MNIRPASHLQAISLCLLVLLLLFIRSIRPATACAADLREGITLEDLQKEKLQEEIYRLQVERRKIGTLSEKLPALATASGAFVALVGLFFTIKKHYEERNKDRAQRNIESARRLDEKFTRIVKDMGSESAAIRASAAISVLTFLNPEYKRFYEQVYLILLANVKVKHDRNINKLMIRSFEKSIRAYLEVMRANEKPPFLDFSRTELNRVDLSGLDLSQSDFAFARFRCANLSNCNLWRMKGIEANLVKARLSRSNLNETRLQKALLNGALLHEVNLVAADLKKADLTGAQFNQAKLQSAHLEGAVLKGAQFEQANLNDAYFIGAIFDKSSMKSILNAYNWEKAHFEKTVLDKLKKLESERNR